MMLDWNEYQKQIGATLGELMKLSPDTVRGYQTLGAANSKTSLLGEKMRQLISLACGNDAVRRLHYCAYRSGPQGGSDNRGNRGGSRRSRLDERRCRPDLFHARPRRRRRQIWQVNVTNGQWLRRFIGRGVTRREDHPASCLLIQQIKTGRCECCAPSTQPVNPAVLKHVPQKLVIDLVMELHFRHLYKRSQLPSATIRSRLF
jgi:hypothetical protein